MIFWKTKLRPSWIGKGNTIYKEARWKAQLNRYETGKDEKKEIIRWKWKGIIEVYLIWRPKWDAQWPTFSSSWAERISAGPFRFPAEPDRSLIRTR